MAKQQFFDNLQRKLATKAMWGWTTFLSEIEDVHTPSPLDIFPEVYGWCSGKITKLQYDNAFLLSYSVTLNLANWIHAKIN